MSGSAVRFSERETGPGVVVVDRIERQRLALHTDRQVSPSPIETDEFPAPMDAAVRIDTGSLAYPTVYPLYVRDEEATLIARTEPPFEREFDPGNYFIEIDGPIKLGLRIQGGFALEVDTDATEITLEPPQRVGLGARSYHEHPAGTVETGPGLVDLATAVSHLSSALKTTSTERSFPTLRGHPPLIQVGDSTRIPDTLTPPDTGIHIEVPRRRAPLYEAAPLAFYLGATLHLGDTPRVYTDSGAEFELQAGNGFQPSVERLLQHTFMLDCLTRIEGYYDVPLHERRALDNTLDLDFAALYDRPIAERLAVHLSVPFEAVESHIPDWKMTAHLDPGIESAEVLPFALNELASIRVHESNPPTPEIHDGQGESTPESAVLGLDPGIGSGSQLVTLPETDSLVDVWFGPGIPTNGTKGLPAGYRHRLERDRRATPISIAVVQIGSKMAAEADLESIYRDRDSLPFDVTLYRDVTRSELRDVLKSEHDFFHYIGHVDEAGLAAVDGRLDTRTLEGIAVDSFLLNACESYEQGIALIEAGAIAGIVTVQNVVNEEAVVVGKTLARLLHRGFPLSKALSVARHNTVIGDFYLVIGDGELSVAQPASGSAIMADIRTGGLTLSATMQTYPTTQKGMGSLIWPTHEANDAHFLNSGSLDIPTEPLIESLSLENIPVLIDGDLYWSLEDDIEALISERAD